MQDKGKLTVQSVGQDPTFNWDWPQWDSPFYKKQNELAMKALLDPVLNPDYSFPTYTKGGGNLKAPSPKKKINKVPEAKPGDDWWIVL